MSHTHTSIHFKTSVASLHPLDCMSFAMENITPALCFCSVHILSPFSPLSQPSLSNDRSITATICGDVMLLESEREGLVVSICSSLWNIPALQNLHGCQTIKANFFPVNGKTIKIVWSNEYTYHLQLSKYSLIWCLCLFSRFAHVKPKYLDTDFMPRKI